MLSKINAQAATSISAVEKLVSICSLDISVCKSIIFFFFDGDGDVDGDVDAASGAGGASTSVSTFTSASKSERERLLLTSDIVTSLKCLFRVVCCFKLGLIGFDWVGLGWLGWVGLVGLGWVLGVGCWVWVLGE